MDGNLCKHANLFHQKLQIIYFYFTSCFQNDSNDATVEAGEQSLEDLMKQMKSL